MRWPLITFIILFRQLFGRYQTDATLVPEDGKQVDAAISQDPCHSCGVSSRRIVANLVEVLEHHARSLQDRAQCCTFCGKLEYIKETKVGLSSCLEYRCTKRPLCTAVHHVETEKDPDTIHLDFVRGTLAIGIGYTQAQELSATMNIPFMSWDLYHSTEMKLGKDIWEVLLISMSEAAETEKHLAKERGEQQDGEGYWRIPVIVDGGWSKRSYGHDYSASGGVAVIVGRYSKRSSI